jgi:hypothetical protein
MNTTILVTARVAAVFAFTPVGASAQTTGPDGMKNGGTTK